MKGAGKKITERENRAARERPSKSNKTILRYQIMKTVKGTQEAG